MKARAIFGTICAPVEEHPVLKYHPKLATNPHFKDYFLFHEYFHGDKGHGVGASRQTGWTGLIAKLLHARDGKAELPSIAKSSAARTAKPEITQACSCVDCGELRMSSAPAQFHDGKPAFSCG